MTDYDRDAALDQLAEWEEEEEAMEAYYAQGFESYQDTIHTEASDDESSSSEMVHVPSEPIQAWTDPETPVENKVDISSYFSGLHAIATQQSSPTETENILLQKIEKETEQKITQILQQNEPLDADICVHIMQQGAEEFKKTTGRNMTYSEMRNAFG